MSACPSSLLSFAATREEENEILSLRVPSLTYLPHPGRERERETNDIVFLYFLLLLVRPTSAGRRGRGPTDCPASNAFLSCLLPTWQGRKWRPQNLAILLSSHPKASKQQTALSHHFNRSSPLLSQLFGIYPLLPLWFRHLTEPTLTYPNQQSPSSILPLSLGTINDKVRRTTYFFFVMRNHHSLHSKSQRGKIEHSCFSKIRIMDCSVVKISKTAKSGSS